MWDMDALDLDAEESVLTDEAIEQLVSIASTGCFMCELDAIEADDAD